MSNSYSLPQQRIEVVDGLRGFALAGIVLVHMLEQYLAGPRPAGEMTLLEQGMIDQILIGIVSFFFQGKAFAMFSILFGLSFFIQMDRADQKGQAFAGRFAWRIFLLLLIGLVHQAFYRGDILTLYAMLGFLLIPFYRLPTKWLVVLISLIVLGLGRYLIFITNGPGAVFGEEMMSPESSAMTHYYQVLREGSLLDIMWVNSTEGHISKLDFQFSIFGRGYLTFAYFLFGLYLGQIGFFKNWTEKGKLLRRVLYIAIAAFFVTGPTMGLAFQAGGGFNPQSWWTIIAFTLMDLNNIATMLILSTGFLLLYRKVKWEKRLGVFAPYGRSALTNYLLQTLVGTFILYNWGLGLIGELRNWQTFSLAIIVLIVQLYLSKWWLDRYRYGLLEWLWRSATYFKWQPLLKEK